MPLGPGEVRYFVDAALVGGEEGDRRRSCIRNDATGKRRVECPDLVKRKREEYTLHTHADQGPIGMPSLIWLYVVMGMRGFLFWDAWHRFHGGVMRALKAAGLWPLICEVVVVLNLPGGPWHGAAFSTRFGRPLRG